MLNASVAIFIFGDNMAQYDGSILVDIKIDTKNASSQLMSLENRMVKTADKIASLRSKMDALKDAKIPTQAYSDAQKEVDKYSNALQRAKERIDKLLEQGVDKDSSRFRYAQYDVAQLENKLLDAEDVVKRLEQEGKAFTLGRDTDQYANLSQQLRYAQNEMEVLNKRHDELIEKQNKNSDGYKKLGDTAKKSLEKINNAQKKSIGLLGSFGSRLKSIIAATFIFNTVRKALNGFVKAVKEGFSNLYNDSNMESFKNTVDSLRASLLTLKNAFAAAFRPLVEMAIPYIQQAVEWMTVLIDKIGQFIAAVSGQKTYTKAIKQTTAALKDQDKAQKKQLSNLDNLNNLTSDKGGAEDVGASTMFEEVPIDKGILDFLQKIKDFLKPIIDYAQKLKDVFMQGFWDGLGDWEYRWESIKDSLKSIKDSLIDIWTDPAVLAAADSWAQSVAYMLGSFVGSLASIGLTIATNLIGGLAKYLEQNKDRIKGYLISMFNIWTEINQMFAELFQSIAYVFEAFASEQGQQLTANIIGIFSDAFMGVSELASKFFRDIANIIIQPFVDNKEAFRTALEGFLGVLSEVTGTIKQGIDDTFAKLNEVYDEHFKPFFDSVAQGISDLTAQFMEFWNGSVQPVLDEWAEKFDVLWKEHIQPAIDNIIEMFGSVADSLKELWDDVLQPFVSWIIDNILPVLLPIIDAIVTTVMDLAGVVFDAIGGIASIVADVVKLIVKLIKGDWSGAWNTAKDIVKKAVDLIKGFITGVIDKISALGSKIKSVFGGNTSGGASGNYGTGRSAGASTYSTYSTQPSQASYVPAPIAQTLANAEIPAIATGQIIPTSVKRSIASSGSGGGMDVSTLASAIEEASVNAMAKVNGGGNGNNGGGGQAINLHLTVECEGYKLIELMRKLDGEFFKQNGKHVLA